MVPDPDRLSGYLSLTKPRIVFLICLSGLGGFFAAGGSGWTPLAFLVCLAAIAGSASAFNCYWDRHLDAKMERTRDRPLPGGALSPRRALVFSAGLLALGAGVGVVWLPLRSLVYVLAGFLAYAVLYTIILKRRHWMGVVLGGSAGSFPVLAGWTAVEPLSLSPVLMALFVFAWTPAHAWALEFVYRDQYERAGIPSYPVVRTRRETARGMSLAAFWTVAGAFLLMPVTGTFYDGVLLGSTPLFLLSYYAFYRRPDKPRAAHAFFTANLYLTVLFIAWAADGYLGHPGGAALWLSALFLPPMFLWVWRARPSVGSVEARLGSLGGELARTLGF